MLKIAIQSFKNSGHQGRGVGVYAIELIQALKKEEDIEIEEFSHVSEIKNKKVDILHLLVFDLFQKSLPNALSMKSIITIHDVTPLVFSKEYPAGIKGAINLFFQKNRLKKIDKVLTVSECSKKDIEKYLGVKQEKISVVHSGVGSHFKKVNDKKLLDGIKTKYQLPECFAFYSGNVNWNKNIVGMTQACIDADLDLVIVGKSFEQKINLQHAEMKSYKEFIEKFSDNPKIHILGYVPDEDMVAILNLSSMALFVSFYEGFGFPILEAQVCEIPVITSNVSSMPEVGGRGALYVDPYNVSEITKAIKRVLGNKNLREELIEKGKINAARFSWKKCAKETIEVYKTIV